METTNIENLLFEKLETIKESKSILDSIYYDDDSQVSEYIENLTATEREYQNKKEQNEKHQ